MSRPARVWSAMTTECASRNCSRKRTSSIAVSSGRPHNPASYQRGRGHDPVTVAGSIRSLVAVNIERSPPHRVCCVTRRHHNGMQDRTRRAAFVAGVLYLVTFAVSIAAVFLLNDFLTESQYALGQVAAGLVLAGAFLDLVNAFACIGTAVAL